MVNLKLLPRPDKPPEVLASDVPLCLVDLRSYADKHWDLTLQTVSYCRSYLWSRSYSDTLGASFTGWNQPRTQNSGTIWTRLFTRARVRPSSGVCSTLDLDL